MKLLYHPHGSAKAVSPFDTAILAAASGHAVRLVCPYIGLSYLQRILAQCSGWQLITDVREWCGSAGSREVGPLLAFLCENLDQVKHLEGVHAKTVIGGSTAYLGSANLTHAGILARTELGVRVDQPELLVELREWFDGLWASADPLLDHDLARLHAWYQQGAAGGRDFAGRGPPKVGRSALRPVAIQDGKAPDRGQKATPTQAVPVPHAAEPEPILANEPATSAPDSDAVTVVEAFIEARAAAGFTVEDVRLALLKAGHDLSAPAIESGLLQYRANHPATVFEPDTVNRLVFSHGAYRQTTAERFKQDVQRFEVYLVALIDALDLRETREVPSFAHLQESGAFTAMELGPLPAQLRRAGMVVDDGKGMRLNPSWEWKGRFQVYEHARTRWMHKLTQGRFAQAPGPIATPRSVPPSIPERRDALVDAIMAATAQLELPNETLASVTVARAEVLAVPRPPESSNGTSGAVLRWKTSKLTDATIDDVFLMVLDLRESGNLHFNTSADLMNHISSSMRIDQRLIEDAINYQPGHPLFEINNWSSQLRIEVRGKYCDGTRFPKTKGRLTRMKAEEKASAQQRQRKAKFIGAYRVTAEEVRQETRREFRKVITRYGPEPSPDVVATYNEERRRILQLLAENDNKSIPVNRHTRAKRRKVLTLKLNALKPPRTPVNM